MKLGGRDPHGNTISLTNYYLLRNGEPYLPIMGEFHYSRFPRRYWDEELHKIQPKASKELKAVIEKFGDIKTSPLHYEVTKSGQHFEIELSEALPK